MYKKSVFIFRRSFRLEDNTGLLAALKSSKIVIPVFIFTPEQIVKNPYKSDNAVQFMLESLYDVDNELAKKGSRLFYFFGKPHEIVEEIIKNNRVDAVFVNQDYTPYSKKRDDQIAKICKKHLVDFNSYEDILLHDAGSVLTSAGTPFKKYTPFFVKGRKIKVRSPKKNIHNNYMKKNEKISSEYKKSFATFYKNNKDAHIEGGRKKALAILKKSVNFKDYDKNRNFLTYDTTHLSAYIKFGSVSIREVYKVFKDIGSKDLMRQLYWRDFYYNIAYFFPHVFVGAMNEKYDKIVWKNKKAWIERWKKGETGFPVVDACMRQLNKTGFMHNRGRLIVSNFLIKILLTDWHIGEKYFANKLVDYDPAVNNGNWQWSASTGADSQPYFRVFNPWLQSKKFDPDCTFIKQWVPELDDVKNADIHNWYKQYKKYKHINYPKPIVDYSVQRKKALNVLYKSVFG